MDSHIQSQTLNEFALMAEGGGLERMTWILGSVIHESSEAEVFVADLVDVTDGVARVVRGSMAQSIVVRRILRVTEADCR